MQSYRNTLRPQANLRPLPMRITQKQYDRLHAARANDQIAIQEHVRRALDQYLDALDRKFRNDNPVPQPKAEAQPTPAQDPSRTLDPSRTPPSKQKLVYR